MKTLTDSEDQKTQKLLKKDYEYLGLIMPIKIKR